MPSIRAAVGAALVALCAAAPAAPAHEGNPNYRSEVRAVVPPVPGLDARVLNHDDRIEFAYRGERPLVVEGYNGEPYLRFRPDGRVELNRRSPATYLNDDRFAEVDVPARADHQAPPEWAVAARHGRYDWHDHRIHWMSEGALPPQVKDETDRVKVFDWRIPLAAGQRASVRGTLTWLGRDDGGFPLAAALSLGAAMLSGGLLVLLVRRHRRARPKRAPTEAW